jgi:hypothetical protein
VPRSAPEILYMPFDRLDDSMPVGGSIHAQTLLGA